MRTFTKPHMLLKVMCISLLPVLQPQELEMQSEVVGYLRRDVTLPCLFVPGPKHDNITQFQWEFQPTEGEKFVIVVSKPPSEDIHESYLRDRVRIEKQSLIISKLEMRDAGSYTCNVATFPGGPLRGTTKLLVQEQMLLSSQVVSIVFSVLVLLAIIAGIGQLIFTRRCGSSARNRVSIDTGAPVMDVTQSSVIVRENVINSDVTLKPSRDATPSSIDKNVDKAHADYVIYSEVVVVPRQLK